MRRHVVLPKVPADPGGEDTVYEWVGSRVKGSQTLNKHTECHHVLCTRDVAVNLQQVKDEVRAPTQDEHCKYIKYNMYNTSKMKYGLQHRMNTVSV